MKPTYYSLEKDTPIYNSIFSTVSHLDLNRTKEINEKSEKRLGEIFVLKEKIEKLSSENHLLKRELKEYESELVCLNKRFANVKELIFNDNIKLFNKIQHLFVFEGHSFERSYLNRYNNQKNQSSNQNNYKIDNITVNFSEEKYIREIMELKLKLEFFNTFTQEMKSLVKIQNSDEIVNVSYKDLPHLVLQRELVSLINVLKIRSNNNHSNYEFSRNTSEKLINTSEYLKYQYNNHKDDNYYDYKNDDYTNDFNTYKSFSRKNDSSYPVFKKERRVYSSSSNFNSNSNINYNNLVGTINDDIDNKMNNLKTFIEELKSKNVENEKTGTADIYKILNPIDNNIKSNNKNINNNEYITIEDNTGKPSLYNTTLEIDKLREENKRFMEKTLVYNNKNDLSSNEYSKIIEQMNKKLDSVEENLKSIEEKRSQQMKSLLNNKDYNMKNNNLQIMNEKAIKENKSRNNQCNPYENKQYNSVQNNKQPKVNIKSKETTDKYEKSTRNNKNINKTSEKDISKNNNNNKNHTFTKNYSSSKMKKDVKSNVNNVTGNNSRIDLTITNNSLTKKLKEKFKKKFVEKNKFEPNINRKNVKDEKRKNDEKDLKQLKEGSNIIDKNEIQSKSKNGDLIDRYLKDEGKKNNFNRNSRNEKNDSNPKISKSVVYGKYKKSCKENKELTKNCNDFKKCKKNIVKDSCKKIKKSSNDYDQIHFIPTSVNDHSFNVCIQNQLKRSFELEKI